MLREKILDFFNLLGNKQGRVIGSILGFFVGILILVIGFLKTIFIIICTLFGYHIGKMFDDRERLYDFLNNIIPFNKD